MLLYENLLCRVDCGVTAVYWDLALTVPSTDTSDDSVWNDREYGFGGNGVGDSNYVPTGPFGENEWRIAPPSNDPTMTNKFCLARDFGEDANILLKIPADHFTVFEKVIPDVLYLMSV